MIIVAIVVIVVVVMVAAVVVVVVAEGGGGCRSGMRDNGKGNGNYWAYIGVKWGYMMETKMEALKLFFRVYGLGVCLEGQGDLANRFIIRITRGIWVIS